MEGYKKGAKRNRTSANINFRSRQCVEMIIRNHITEVSYNAQSTVDAKHNIPIDFNVTNQNDSKAMGAMVRRAKTILREI